METINFLSVDAILQNERRGTKNNRMIPLPYSVNRNQVRKEIKRKFLGLCTVIGIIFLVFFSAV